MSITTTAQLGFESLLCEAETTNRQSKFERKTAHLPATIDEALSFYRVLLRQHHAAMLDADIDRTIALREEAYNLALKLNGGEPGIIAHDDAPGYVLANGTTAAPGSVPLWGQSGIFTIDVSGMRVRISMKGIFGIGGRYLYWPGFAAHGVDPDKPFLSCTGYRSFLGCSAEPQAGLTPDEFAGKVIEAHIADELGGKLVMIGADYCERLVED